MNTINENFAADIPLDLATRAHEGTSHTPEVRGENEIADYAATLAADLAEFRERAEKHGTQDQLAELFPRYREAFRKCKMAHLSAKSRCISTLICGPANFPVRRAEKANASEHRRLEELLDCRNKWRKRIFSAITPDDGSGPIRSGSPDAVARLEAEIATLEERQRRMKRVNEIIRANWPDREAAAAAIRAEGFPDEYAQAAITPDGFGGFGFQPFTLRNNSANIRRLKQRLEHEKRLQALPTTTEGGPLAKVEDCPGENRVRLFFPGKPDAVTRASLKREGFRWTPSLGCWQAYRRHHTLHQARKFAGLID